MIVPRIAGVPPRLELRHQLPRDRLRHQEPALEIDPDHAVELRFIDIEKTALFRDARIVHQHIDPPVRLQRRGGQVQYVEPLGDVTVHENRIAATFVQFPGGRLSGSFIPVCQDHMRTVACKPRRAGQTDPRAPRRSRSRPFRQMVRSRRSAERHPQPRHLRSKPSPRFITRPPHDHGLIRPENRDP